MPLTMPLTLTEIVWLVSILSIVVSTSVRVQFVTHIDGCNKAEGRWKWEDLIQGGQDWKHWHMLNPLSPLRLKILTLGFLDP